MFELFQTVVTADAGAAAGRDRRGLLTASCQPQNTAGMV
jgi:hypothetical protein